MPRLFLSFFLLFIGGCAIPQPKVDPNQLANAQEMPDRVESRVTADWDDLIPAVAIGLGKLNLAVVDVRPESDARFEYDLVDVLDRPALLTIERLTTQDPGQDPGPILITCRFTRFRDLKRERLLVAAIAQRFTELRGVDVAPVR